MPIKLRIRRLRDRPTSVQAPGWVAALTMVLGATAALATPPEPASAAGSAPRTEAAPPDDEFIEFLGADDVGDAAWWEFLKKTVPREDESSRAPPAQDATQ